MSELWIPGIHYVFCFLLEFTLKEAFDQWWWRWRWWWCWWWWSVIPSENIYNFPIWSDNQADFSNKYFRVLSLFWIHQWSQSIFFLRLTRNLLVRSPGFEGEGEHLNEIFRSHVKLSRALRPMLEAWQPTRGFFPCINGTVCHIDCHMGGAGYAVKKDHKYMYI